MRTLLALFVLAVAVATVPAAPVPEVPAAPLKSPTDTELDALIAETLSRDPRRAEKAAHKLVALGPVAVPALTQGLWGDSATRRTCLRVLAGIGPDARPAAPSLVRLLGAESPEVRCGAARALGAVGAHRAIPALAQLLDDPSIPLKLCAAEALVALDAGAEVLLPVLTAALKSEQPEVAGAAARLLAALGPEAAPAVPALNDRLAGADPLLTALIADAVGRVGPAAKDALPALKTKTKEEKNAARYRASAALALWRAGRDPDAIALLRDALGESGGVAALAPLWRLDRSKETIEAIEKRLKAGDAAEAVLTARTLGAASKESLPALLSNLSRASDDVRASAVQGLGEFGPAATAALEPLRKAIDERGAAWTGELVTLHRIAPSARSVRALTDLLEDKDRAPEAAEALKELRPTGQAVVLELLAALDNPDERVRFACAVALWRIEKHPRALPVVTKRLRAADPQTRAGTATAVGAEFGPDAKSAVPELVKRLFDPFASVRAASAEALGRVGPGARDAVQPLLALLEADEPAFVQSAACEALGLILPGERDEVANALKRKLKHPDALVRVHAALALLRVAQDRAGEKEIEPALAWRTHPVRVTAAEAAWRLGKDARAVPLLVRALEESNLEGTGGENERYMAARALGRIGADARDAVPELVRLVGHRDHALADAARTALKAIAPGAAKKAGGK